MTVQSETFQGLTVLVDLENNLISFDWDEAEHPEWNFLSDIGEEGIKEMLLRQAQKTIDEASK